MATYDIVEGSTDALQFQLLDNGTAIDLSNMTVTLLLNDKSGTAIVMNWTISPFDATNGRITFTPGSTSLLVAASGPYYARWKLVNSVGGGISYVPSATRDVWNISGV